ncbi:Toll/interleukin-1 receptor homology (TIR) domain [Arabidopsis suecica]|uniref:ADP-ribosyl cyclase/cyclic ADP-ribose hydrolase n=1 Tax=Arabidopsis suecica TaxID=45249 RepID=A0A8T1XQP6_ARASU|nr:Toll/interleukin-1 receptor homology (TIR) domain [Arabidopsis suecica]
MAPCSSSGSSSCWKYDVFPSFRGEDVRGNFLSHLMKEFESKGIVTFKDDLIERSHTIGLELKEAVRQSKTFVVLFSKNYASSSWCLDELVEILKCKEERRLIPIFYKVNPSDVRNQTGKFGRGFRETCEGKNDETQNKWKEALTEAANIAGEDSQSWKNEADFITKIAKDISAKLNGTPSNDFENFIGIESHMSKMVQLLCLNNDEVRMVGIWGPAGIGKTTIARVLHSRLSSDFRFTVFMENVRGNYQRIVDSGGEYNLQVRLQKELLSTIFNQKDMRINHLGTIEERLKKQKVLIVLDDVNKVEQLEAFANETRWFGPGSRIIVTTKDKQVLVGHGINHIYEVKLPCRKTALEILCLYAFKQNVPPDDFMDVVVEVAELSGHLPLGLRVLGSHMRGKSKDRWKLELRRLTTSLDEKVEKILKISYDELHVRDKALFLHIACMFNGDNIDLVKQLLVNSDLDVSLGLQLLLDKSLIQINDDREIVVHSLLLKMGREVVCQHSSEPGKRQFLFNTTETCNILANNTGSGAVLGISLDMSEIQNDVFMSERVFEDMHNLKFLRFYNKKFDENPSFKLHLPRGLDYLPSVRLLHWDSYPMKYIPSQFRPECLVELRMMHSKVVKLWEGTQTLAYLKTIDLSFSNNLLEVPDLSKARSLETLCLEGCQSLTELPSSVLNLHRLKWLRLTMCEKLEVIPLNINLASLEVLDMEGCSKLKSFPDISKSIERIFMRNTGIEEIPPSISQWFRLESLDISGCLNLKIFSHVPNSVVYIYLTDSGIERLPDCIKDLPWLHYLYVDNCRKLVSLPELPSSIKILSAINCESLERISSSFHCSNAKVEFSKSMNLDGEARRVITQQWVYKRACLPGREVPPEFSYRARGDSLSINLEDERVCSSTLRFKACLLLLPSERNNICTVYCRLICESGRLIATHRFGGVVKDFVTPHLFIFNSVLLEEVDVIRFEFSSIDHEITECGVQILTDT